MLQFALGIRQKIGHWLNGRKSVQSHGFNGPISEKKSVLILCDLGNEQDKRSMSLVKAEMRKLCPQASINIACCYNKGCESAYNLISDDDVKYFSEDRFSFFFMFKDVDLLHFLQRKRDIAVFLIKPDDVVVANFASSYVNADLRVGLAKSELASIGFLNLCISSDSDKKDAIADVVGALKMLFA
ncbi:MAG: DUF6913 domain-containing protein [Marinilabiliaceae bacterium]